MSFQNGAAAREFLPWPEIASEAHQTSKRPVNEFTLQPSTPVGGSRGP